MKAAYLVRCSTNKQDYDRQISDLNKEAESFNLLVHEKHIFGEHITGKDDTTKGDRLSITKLKNAVEKKEFDVILISEVSRLSRDPVSGRVYIRQFNNLKIPVYFRDKRKWTIDPHTGIVDNSFEKELGHYFDGASEYLKSMKTQITSGRRKKAEENQMVIGRPAFGYKRRGGTDKAIKSTLVVDPEKSKIVIDIYKTYLEEGSTIKSTALFISDKYKVRTSVSRVYQVLTHPSYHSGKTVLSIKDPDRPESPPSVYTITYDIIISEEDYLAVKKKLEKNRNTLKTRYATQKVHLLTRLIKCPSCGHSFSPKRREDRRNAISWVCMSRINNQAECKSFINLNDDIIRSVLWSLLKIELITFIDIGDQQKNEKIKETLSRISLFEVERESLLREKKEVDKKEERAYRAYFDAPESIQERAKQSYYETTEKTSKERKYLESRIDYIDESIKDCNTLISRLKTMDITEGVINEIEADPSKKRALVTEYIKAIYPYKVNYRVVTLEVHTTSGIYYVLINANQKRNRNAYYIHESLAIWQKGNNRVDTFPEGDYFFVGIPTILIDTEFWDTEFSFDRMVEACYLNDYVITY